MKKILAIALAAMLAAVSLTGCGGTQSENKAQIDVSKVNGVTLKSEAKPEDTHAQLGTAEVTIGEAKVIDYKGENVVIVEYTYKNNGSSDMPFTGAVRDSASQDEHTLSPTVIDNVDGVNMLALSENVAPGHQISVQKAYRLRNNTNDITVEVVQISNGKDAPKYVTKTYSFN